MVVEKKTTKRKSSKKENDIKPLVVNADIKKVELKEEVNRNKNTFAYSINLYRSFIDIRDGFKPVGRRIIYSLDKMKATKFTKVSAVTGFCLGSYHPHGIR